MQLDCHDAGEDSSHSQLVFPCMCLGLCFERLCIFVQATHTGICPRCAVPPTVWSSGATPCQSLQCCLLDLYGCVFFSGVQILVRVGSSSSANHTHESYPEPYPESYLRIIPPKITIMNVSFGSVWDCMASLVLMDVTSQLTSVGSDDPWLPSHTFTT